MPTQTLRGGCPPPALHQRPRRKATRSPHCPPPPHRRPWGTALNIHPDSCLASRFLLRHMRRARTAALQPCLASLPVTRDPLHPHPSRAQASDKILATELRVGAEHAAMVTSALEISEEDVALEVEVQQEIEAVELEEEALAYESKLAGVEEAVLLEQEERLEGGARNSHLFVSPCFSVSACFSVSTCFNTMFLLFHDVSPPCFSMFHHNVSVCSACFTTMCLLFHDVSPQCLYVSP